MFNSFEAVLRQLEAALSSSMVMTELRRLVPQWSSSPLNDRQVLHHVASLVTQGRASLTTAAGPNDLPWPEILKDLERFEGNVPHMYLDTKGYVTVGVGKMLPSSAEAQKLPFVVRATKAPATAAEIKADFDAVKAQTAGMNWRKYKSSLDLPQPTIDALAKEIAIQCNDEVAARYKDYEKYPVEVKQVLIDMRYNMGPNMDKFKNFKANVESAHQTGSADSWRKAAKESHRKGIQDDRNDWAHDMILKGAGITE